MAKVLKHSNTRHTMMWQWLSIRRPQKIHWFPIALAISIGFAWGSLILRHTQIVSSQTDPNKNWSERLTVEKPTNFAQGREPRSSRIRIELAFSGHSTHIKKPRTQEGEVPWCQIMDFGSPIPRLTASPLALSPASGTHSDTWKGIGSVPHIKSQFFADRRVQNPWKSPKKVVCPE